FSLVVGNGQTLLSGDTVFPLAAVHSSEDPSRLAVAYTATNGTTVELPDSRVSGGMLGGLLAFRTESLDPVQNELGRLAVGLAVAFNELHKQGVDLHNDSGQPFFSVPESVYALADAGNTDSTAVLSF